MYSAHVLTIVQEVSHTSREEDGGPYLVRCYLDADVAHQYGTKLYDGLEYGLAEDYACIIYMADIHCSREAATYENSPWRFQGHIAPRY